MNILIDGTNTLNKGAELMLLAVLEQIESFDQNSIVFYNSNQPGEKQFTHNFNLRIKRNWINKYNRISVAVLRKLGLPYAFLTSKHPRKNIDLVLDAAGFQFSDQWNYTKQRLDILENYYKTLKSFGTKIVLLPQAFGPFKTKNGIRSVEIISKYADLIYAREKVSYDFLIGAGCDPSKVRIQSDFTLLSKGSFPFNFEHLKGQVCIIPNKKMITHVSKGASDYLGFMKRLALELQELNQKLFILNHEGVGDLNICNILNEALGGKIEVVNGLNALEVKGLIGGSKMVVSSRYHGVASALNQVVPCLATSWNHKYEMLFKDFGINDGVLDISKPELLKNKLVDFFNNYDQTKTVLEGKKIVLSTETRKMWEDIWDLYSYK